jgi:hypothetical protein
VVTVVDHGSDGLVAAALATITESRRRRMELQRYYASKRGTLGAGEWLVLAALGLIGDNPIRPTPAVRSS